MKGTGALDGFIWYVAGSFLEVRCDQKDKLRNSQQDSVPVCQVPRRSLESTKAGSASTQSYNVRDKIFVFLE